MNGGGALKNYHESQRPEVLQQSRGKFEDRKKETERPEMLLLVSLPLRRREGSVSAWRSY